MMNDACWQTTETSEAITLKASADFCLSKEFGKRIDAGFGFSKRPTVEGIAEAIVRTRRHRGADWLTRCPSVSTEASPSYPGGIERWMDLTAWNAQLECFRLLRDVRFLTRGLATEGIRRPAFGSL